MAVLRCPNCSQQLQVPDGASGAKLLCPACMTIITTAPPPVAVKPKVAKAVPVRPAPPPVVRAVPTALPEAVEIPVAEVEEPSARPRPRKKKLHQQTVNAKPFIIVGAVLAVVLVAAVVFVLFKPGGGGGGWNPFGGGPDVDSAQIWRELDTRLHAQAIVREHGKHRVVAFAITGMDGLMDGFDQLSPRIRALIEKPNAQGSTMVNGVVYAYAAQQEDLDACAKKVDFGTVTRIDKEQRVIVIAVDRGWLEGVRQQRQNDPIAAAIADVKAGNPLTEMDALNVLAEAQPEERHRQAVLDAIMKRRGPVMMNFEKRHVEVLERWAKPGELAPLLIQVLQRDGVGFGKDEIIEALGRTQDERVINPLLDYLRLDHQGKVKRALVPFGPKVEDAVLERYEKLEQEASERLYSLLAEVGTEKCLERLEKVKDEPIRGRQVRLVIAAIKKRIGQ